MPDNLRITQRRFGFLPPERCRGSLNKRGTLRDGIGPLFGLGAPNVADGLCNDVSGNPVNVGRCDTRAFASSRVRRDPHRVPGTQGRTLFRPDPHLPPGNEPSACGRHSVRAGVPVPGALCATDTVRGTPAGGTQQCQLLLPGRWLALVGPDLAGPTSYR